MGIGIDSGSPAKQYAERWKAKRRLEQRIVRAWVIQTKEPFKTKLLKFLAKEFPKYHIDPDEVENEFNLDIYH